MTGLTCGVQRYVDLHASKKAKRAAAIAKITKPVKKPWAENDATEHPFRPTNASAKEFECTGPAAGPRGTGGSHAAGVQTMAEPILLTTTWAMLAQIATFSVKHATTDWVWEQNVPGKKRPLLRRNRTGNTGPQHRHRLGQGIKWYGITAGSLMVHYGMREFAAAFGARDISMLWSTQCWQPAPFVANAMPRDVFDQHAQFMRFHDVGAAPRHGDYDNGWHSMLPVIFLINHFKRLWPKHWTMGEWLASVHLDLNVPPTFHVN